MNYFEQSGLEILKSELEWHQIPYMVEDFEPTHDRNTVLRTVECYWVDSEELLAKRIDHYILGDAEWVKIISLVAEKIVEEVRVHWWKSVKITVKKYPGLYGMRIKLCCRNIDIQSH
jgi:hypothetical protein